MFIVGWPWPFSVYLHFGTQADTGTLLGVRNHGRYISLLLTNQNVPFSFSFSSGSAWTRHSSCVRGWRTKWLTKIKRRIIFRDLWKLHEIQIVVLLSIKFYLDKVILSVYCLWLMHATTAEMSYNSLRDLKYLLSGPSQRGCCTLS